VNRRALGALLALGLAAGVVHLRQQWSASPHVRYDRFDLPGFDAHVYVAMAEQPRFFTVAPWGFRVLTPWLVHALPASNVARGFRWVSVGALAAAAALLFLYLDRLGFAAGAALAGSAAFAVSGPVGEAARYRFLAEPLTAALEVGYLWAIAAGARAGPLALIALLGVLAKEYFLLLLPLPWLLRRGRLGDARAAGLALLAAVPAVAAFLGLRLAWAPHLPAPLPAFGGEALGLAWRRLGESWSEWAPAALLAGLTPLAILGACRRAGRELRWPAAYVTVVTLAAPLLNPVAFFPADMPRLLLYVLPLAIPLALVAVDRLHPLRRAPAEPAETAPGPRAVGLAAGGVAAVLAVGVVAGVDRYQRLDLSGPRDGPRLLALCRESLRTARRLERGQEVLLDVAAHRFVWGNSDPGDLSQMRWFLLDGWGDRPQYGEGEAVLAAGEAGLLVPVLGRRDLLATVEVQAPHEVPLELWLGGERVAAGRVGRSPILLHALLPGAGLRRGDNRLRLAAPAGGVRLLSYRLGAGP
jgi:hypothetical protein